MTHFDVIVVGSGSAGAPLAARLAEDESRSVLLLEAGPSHDRIESMPDDLLNAEVAAGAVPGHPSTWTYTSRLNDEVSTAVTRGRVIGGSSSINGTVFTRATPADFNRWAALGNDEWSYEKVLPFFVKLEHDHDFPDAPYHGSDGPIAVTRGLNTPLADSSRAFIEACAQLGFAEEPDKNAGATPGYGRVPLSSFEGIRSSTAIGYLLSDRRPPNLEIRGDSFVRRVVFEGSRAVGVEVESGNGTQVVRGDEIVLSAGGLNTPHLLLLSGIGPADELHSFGIRVLSDLPGVGTSAGDHPEVFIGYEPTSRLARRPGKRIFQTSLSFTAPGSSFEGDLELIPVPGTLMGMVMPPLGQHGVAATARRTIGMLGPLLAQSPKIVLQQARRRNDYVFAASLMQLDEYRGAIKLASSDPHQQPLIECHYMETESDLARARHAVRTAVEILESPSFSPLVRKRTSPGREDLVSDTTLDAWLRRSVATAFHTSASAHMGPDSDPTAVVDQYCRVYGVEGLRVIDTSAFPTPVRRGPNATAVMFGERAAAFFDR